MSICLIGALIYYYLLPQKPTWETEQEKREPPNRNPSRTRSIIATQQRNQRGPTLGAAMSSRGAGIGYKNQTLVRCREYIGAVSVQHSNGSSFYCDIRVYASRRLRLKERPKGWERWLTVKKGLS